MSSKIWLYDDNDASLAGAWHMDEYTGTTIADASGNGNTGTFGGGAAAPTWVNSGAHCLSFDGGDVITGTDTGFPSGNSARGISVWFNTTKNHVALWSQSVILGYGLNNLNQATIIGMINPGVANKIFVSQYGNLVSTPLAYNDGLWHLVVVVFNGVNTWSIYIDGAFKISGAMTTATVLNGTSLSIGAGSGAAYPWTGLIDEPRIYGRILNQTQITNLYLTGKLKHQ